VEHQRECFGVDRAELGLLPLTGRPEAAGTERIDDRPLGAAAETVDEHAWTDSANREGRCPVSVGGAVEHAAAGAHAVRSPAVERGSEGVELVHFLTGLEKRVKCSPRIVLSSAARVKVITGLLVARLNAVAPEKSLEISLRKDNAPP